MPQPEMGIDMPKEIGQFADTSRPDPSSIEIVWAKPEGGGNLQIHFQRHCFNDKGEEVQNPEIDQYSDQLSRNDCNRLIRALRRARDAVYGTDA